MCSSAGGGCLPASCASQSLGSGTGIIVVVHDTILIQQGDRATHGVGTDFDTKGHASIMFSGDFLKNLEKVGTQISKLRGR